MPVDQDRFGVPGGNCFSACVASLLEMPLANVPYFMGDPQVADERGEWFERFANWLKPHGFYPLFFEYRPNGWKPSGLCIIGGKSPRGDHAVAGDGWEVIHDPHPSREGLLSIEDCTLLVPFDPARSRRQP